MHFRQSLIHVNFEGIKSWSFDLNWELIMRYLAAWLKSIITEGIYLFRSMNCDVIKSEPVDRNFHEIIGSRIKEHIVNCLDQWIWPEFGIDSGRNTLTFYHGTKWGLPGMIKKAGMDKNPDFSGARLDKLTCTINFRSFTVPPACALG